MIPIALVTAVIISTGSLAWGYWQSGFKNEAFWIAMFGVIWIASYWRKWRWVPTLAVFLSLLLAAVGIWFEFHPGWMLNGAIFALIAWDLTEFRQKLKLMPVREDIPGRTRRRILRISVLTLAALALVSCLMLLRAEFTADWGLFLAAATLFGLSQSLAWKQR